MQNKPNDTEQDLLAGGTPPQCMLRITHDELLRLAARSAKCNLARSDVVLFWDNSPRDEIRAAFCHEDVVYGEETCYRVRPGRDA